MTDSTTQIKEKLDIADFVRTYVQLHPAGRNLKGLCPFHKEKTPSFIVSPDRQTWHCFGCGIGGDVFAFMMKYENIDFVEALKILGEKTGVDIGRVGNNDQKQVNILYEVNNAAKTFFKHMLRQPEGKAAIEYLKKRAMTGETAQEFEIGFAPDGIDLLLKYLTGKGFPVSVIESAGLVFRTERGTFMDRFRARIIFPLYNHFGKVVGFTGRIMPGHEHENTGKYMNSPETPVFNKSKVLYGFDRAKNNIREAGAAVLVEGQMDFIMAWQDGVKNLVATSGTALTVEHLKALRRAAETLILSFDQDEAGRVATERAIDLAGAADFAVKVMDMPADLEAKDPADIAVAKPGLLKSLATSAMPAMEYYFSRYLKGGSATEIKKDTRVVLSKIKFLTSPVERAHWLKEVSRRSGIQENYLIEELEAIKVVQVASPARDNESVRENEPMARKDLISQRLASLVIGAKNKYPILAPIMNDLPGPYRDILRSNCGGESVELTAEHQRLLDVVSMRASLEIPKDEVALDTELGKLVLEIRLESLREQRYRISEAIRVAEIKGEDIGPLLSEKQKIADEFRRLEVKGAKVV